MEHLKIIFLDIDGVLNNQRLIAELYSKAAHDGVSVAEAPFILDPAAIDRLNRIIDATGAQVVISSSWKERGEEFVRRKLRAKGFTGTIIGCTGTYPPRHNEIAMWLAAHEGQVESFIILEDLYPMPGLEHRTARTSHVTGLLEHQVAIIIDTLNRS